MPLQRTIGARALRKPSPLLLFLASLGQLTHPLIVRSTSQAQRDIIFELRRIAFDAESDSSNVPGSGTEKRKAMYTKDYKMLGFTVSFPDLAGLLPGRKPEGPPNLSPGHPSFTLVALE